jgi:hypothetical protein
MVQLIINLSCSTAHLRTFFTSRLCGILANTPCPPGINTAVYGEFSPHGPASLLAAAVGEQPENYIFKGYQICVFPDSLDVMPLFKISTPSFSRFSPTNQGKAPGI